MRVLITGGSGQLGAYLLRDLQRRDHEVLAWSGTGPGELFSFKIQPVDVLNHDRLANEFHSARPDVVIHAAGITTVAGCFNDSKLAFRVNAEASARIARLCGTTGIRLIFTSTDLVFDGSSGNYTEGDTPRPLSVYGLTKRAAEEEVLNEPNSAVVRLSLLYGPALNGRPGFFDTQAIALRERRPITLFADEWRTPLGLHTAAGALIAIAESEFTGVLHVGGPERLTRLETGTRLARFLGVASPSIVAANRDDVPAPEPRPRDVTLNSSNWRGLFPEVPWPRFEEGLQELSEICRF
jgi:dTDP-4-dehydrorhamnose reductase